MENEEFNLIYYHRHTGEPYKVKRVTKNDFIILYPDGERVRISEYFLKKVWRPDKNNNKPRMRSRLNFKREKELT